ncbi:MAG: LysE family transporter [Actinomycetales bacterium]|nr:LysE family transporter [Tetrasphaera sp.]NLW98524.1 LysE family transporter [Actinomycetales bacterium]
MDLLLLGLSLGAGAGISPGPLLVLVVTAAVRGGRRAGVLAALAPLVSDAVVIVGVLVVLQQLPDQALAVLAVAGGLFLLWTAWVTIREAKDAQLESSTRDERRLGWQALRSAAVLNVLSPHPWLFWATVLGPLTLQTWRDSPAGAIWLVLGFYVAIVGAKAVIAVAVAGGRSRLTDRIYRRVLVAAGVLLALVGVVVIVEFLPSALGSVQLP